VQKGKIRNKIQAEVLRNGEVVHTGHISTLKRFKDDVKEVTEGFECGVTISHFDTVAVGDIIEAYDKYHESGAGEKKNSGLPSSN
jgi:translation initiation factor IF-2